MINFLICLSTYNNTNNALNKVTLSNPTFVFLQVKYICIFSGTILTVTGVGGISFDHEEIICPIVLTLQKYIILAPWLIKMNENPVFYKCEFENGFYTAIELLLSVVFFSAIHVVSPLLTEACEMWMLLSFFSTFSTLPTGAMFVVMYSIRSTIVIRPTT